MKYVLLTAIAAVSLSAQAFLGYPPREEMNKVTIQKVAAILKEKGQVPSPFQITTVKLNNVYRVDAKGCTYKASVIWDDFGWPDVRSVRVKLVSCR